MKIENQPCGFCQEKIELDGISGYVEAWTPHAKEAKNIPFCSRCYNTGEVTRVIIEKYS